MTVREKVVSLRNDGLNYAQISAQLGITKSTVSWHASEDSRKTYRAARIRNRRLTVIKLKMDAGGRCSSCGYSKCLDALQFHHINPEDKHKTRKSNGQLIGVTGLARQRNLKLAVSEARKCALLCANCHAEEHAKNYLSA